MEGAGATATVQAMVTGFRLSAALSVVGNSMSCAMRGNSWSIVPTRAASPMLRKRNAAYGAKPTRSACTCDRPR